MPFDRSAGFLRWFRPLSKNTAATMSRSSSKPTSPNRNNPGNVMLRVASSVLREQLVGIAVQPPFSRLRRGDHGMPGGLRMLGGVTVGGAVAAQGGAALLARAQMDPLRLDLDALGALAVLGLLHVGDGAQMSATSVGHRSPSLLVQHLVYGGDRDRSLAHGRRHALQAPGPDIADREDARQAGLEQMRSAGEGPA